MRFFRVLWTRNFNYRKESSLKHTLNKEIERKHRTNLEKVRVRCVAADIHEENIDLQ